MNLRLVAGSAIVLSILLASCGSPPGTTTQPPGNPDDVTSAQVTVNALAAAKPSGNIPAHFRTHDIGDLVRQEGDFDVNAYFTVLTHLSVEPGWVIDYLYRMRGMGGGPFVYARPADRAPYSSFDEYVAAAGGATSAGAGKDYSRDYLEHVKIDDTREGYFQFVLLMMMDDQFYQYWHSGYNDTAIVGDREALERTMAAAGSAFEGVRVPGDVQEAARKIDLAPTVEFPDASTAVARVVTFSKWGGFIEHEYTISRAFPHEVLDETSRTLVEYDCGVQF
jgi:hypothetical protein